MQPFTLPDEGGLTNRALAPSFKNNHTIAGSGLRRSRKRRPAMAQRNRYADRASFGFFLNYRADVPS
jgi:hypothetical protein